MALILYKIKSVQYVSYMEHMWCKKSSLFFREGLADISHMFREIFDEFHTGHSNLEKYNTQVVQPLKNLHRPKS